MSRWKLKKLGTFALSVAMAFLIAIPAKAVELPAEDMQGHWAKIPMAWAKEKGLITGTSAMTLSPDLTTSRAMAVTVLYRYQGSPEVKPARSFSDVSPHAYYANAVDWAIHKFNWKRTRTAYDKAYFKIIDTYDFVGGPAITGVIASMAGTHEFPVEIYGLVQNGVLK